jgi:hypothetical protein
MKFDCWQMSVYRNSYGRVYLFRGECSNISKYQFNVIFIECLKKRVIQEFTNHKHARIKHNKKKNFLF